MNLSPLCTQYTLDYYLELADQLVSHGVHALAIKDMAGLLKPRAAEILVGTLRREFPDTVIHVHTHDTVRPALDFSVLLGGRMLGKCLCP